MPRYKLLVLTEAVEGREDEFNDWYQSTHLGQLTQVPGFVAAQRFKLTKALTPQPMKTYLSIYDIEAEDVHAALREMKSRSGTDRMVMSGAMATGSQAFLYEEIGTKVEADGAVEPPAP